MRFIQMFQKLSNLSYSVLRMNVSYVDAILSRTTVILPLTRGGFLHYLLVIVVILTPSQFLLLTPI